MSTARHLADLELAVAEDLAVSFGPADGLLAVRPSAATSRRQLVLAAIGTALHGAFSVRKTRRFASCSRQAGPVDEPARLKVLADERAHLLDEVQRGGIPASVFGCSCAYHENAWSAPTRATIRRANVRRGRGPFWQQREMPEENQEPPRKAMSLFGSLVVNCSMRRRSSSAERLDVRRESSRPGRRISTVPLRSP